MNHEQIKIAREAMGMTPDQLAAIMEVKRVEIYRIESAKTAKQPGRRFVTLMRALMDGWRP
jgi:transcriptional regulator with XRE-family HTH domain